MDWYNLIERNEGVFEIEKEPGTTVPSFVATAQFVLRSSKRINTSKHDFPSSAKRFPRGKIF